MKMDDVIRVIKLLEANNITVHVDGGWGVDALLGEQTRQHDDLDIAIQFKDVTKVHELLANEGFKETPRNDSTKYMFVLRDNNGREIDVHSYTFDNTNGLVEGIAYPHESLSGEGAIGTHKVKCINAEYVIKFHSAYEPKQKDIHDVLLLCERFNIVLPSEYQQYGKTA